MKKEKNSKESTKIKSNENEKELKNEKEYLAGREHIVSKNKDKNIKKESEEFHKNDLTKQSNENKDKTDIFNGIQDEEKPKIMIEIKPRETYLKDKINKMKFNNNILSGINTGINEQLKSVKKDMISKKVLVNEKPKSLEKHINKSFEFGANINNDNFNIKNKYKSIKELKAEKENINKKLVQLIENENILENKKGSEFLVEQNLKEKLKKDVNNQKKQLIQKIEDIDLKIKDMLLEVDNINNKKQINLKNFIDNFERDKEIVEIRAKKYLKEKRERNKRISNDLNQLAEKRKKELEDKNKKEKEDQKKLANKLKQQAKEIENKQSKAVGQQSLLYKPYINGKIDGSVKKYLFVQKYEKFLKNEQILLDKENIYRKNKMKHISNEEIELFNNKIDKRREEKKIMTDKKTEKLLEEWNERKKTIPTYISPLSENACIDIKKQYQEEKDKKEKIEELIEKKNQYSNSLKQPQVNKELEQKRIETINNLDPKRFLLDKAIMQHKDRKGRILLKKRDPSKPSKYSWDLKILDTSENEISIQRQLIKKPKQYKLSMSMERTPNNILPTIKKDFLQEMIKDKENKENSKIKSSKELMPVDNFAKSSAKKWEKIINDNGDKSLVDNINNARKKLELIELKAIQNEKLLKAQDITSNDIKLNQKVSDLIIDSIEAKLSLLNQMK